MRSSYEYLDEMTTLIGEADTHWQMYIKTLAFHYAIAYKKQSSVLDEVNKNLKSDQVAARSAITFMLSIFTMGTGGSIASIAFASPIGDVAASASKRVVDKVASDPVVAGWLHSAVKELAKDKIEEFESQRWDSLTAPTTAEILASLRPATLSPEQYLYQLEMGYLSRKMLVQSFARLVRHRTAGVPPERAAKILETFQGDSFLSAIPRLEPGERLSKKLQLALWIAWLWTQPIAYWEKASYSDSPVTRALQPVYQDLLALGVPASQIQGLGPKFTYRATQSSSFKLYSGPNPSSARLDMAKTIRWAMSSEAMNLVFGGVSNSSLAKDIVRMSSLFSSLRVVLGLAR